ncbi:hypothetical protein EON65_33580, partial [archaeon]
KVVNANYLYLDPNSGSDVSSKISSIGDRDKQRKFLNTILTDAFYHVLLMLVSCYGAMILTAWGGTNGAPPSHTHKESDASMWLKIVSQWVFFILYVKTLHVHYINNENNH